jgi:hypothetical protein
MLDLECGSDCTVGAVVFIFFRVFEHSAVSSVRSFSVNLSALVRAVSGAVQGAGSKAHQDA